MIDASPAGTPCVRESVLGAEFGERRVRIVRGVCQRDEFNALRERLPRSVRRGVAVVPEGHVGLIVQAIGGLDSLLLSEYGHIPADLDPTDALGSLERRLRARLG